MNEYMRLYREYSDHIHATDDDPYAGIDPMADEEALLSFYGSDRDTHEIFDMINDEMEFIVDDDEDAEWMALCEGVDELYDYAPERF